MENIVYEHFHRRNSQALKSLQNTESKSNMKYIDLFIREQQVFMISNCALTLCTSEGEREVFYSQLNKDLKLELVEDAIAINEKILYSYPLPCNESLIVEAIEHLDAEQKFLESGAPVRTHS